MRIGSRILAAAEILYPGYFALVMATGALSIALYLLRHETLARALFAVNVLAYSTLTALLLLRVAYFRARILTDLLDYGRAPGFFTLVAGTCVFGTNIAVTMRLTEIATVFWGAGILLWVLVMYSFFAIVVTRADKPDLESGINGAWLIAAVATQSVAVLGGTLAPSFAAPMIPLFFCVVMYLIGAMLYLTIITLIFYRLTFIRLTSAAFLPPYWINMGAVAITTLAGATLISRAALSPVLMELLPFLRGFTLFFWASATWWIPLLLILMAWRHLVMRYPFEYEPQYWGMAFPLAMYTTGTWRLADALKLDFLMTVPRLFVWLAGFVWLVVFGGMFHAILAAWRDKDRVSPKRLSGMKVRPGARSRF
ncbi:MAG TPA: tellurite resistance/C4-dicarboxylate transporter family protein [Stellaceae bacterium]|nr:tellurite resistance/C4-dicarboxylate transporter family protein [Stellaceae bacterium]